MSNPSPNHSASATSNSLDGGFGSALVDPTGSPQNFAADHEPLASSQPAPKRPRTRSSRAITAYPRKRALAACRLCRARKVKCNNARPSCGSCTTSNAQCVYEDVEDMSNFDPASIMIVNRLNQILARLNQPPESLPGLEHIWATGQETGQETGPPPPHQAPNIPEAAALKQSRQSKQVDIDDMRIPPQQTNPDAVLAWPILESRYPLHHLTDAVFEAELVDRDLEPEEPAAHRMRGWQGFGKDFAYGINEDEIPGLVERFLAFVHSKNPILDVDTLWMYVDRVAEVGLTWDSATCLVLLVCALGCIAPPFVIHESPSPPDPWPRMPTSREADAETLRRANAYYTLARRRFGLLETGILAPQCHFLAGVYTMYTMAPLKAWSQFHSASRACHVYLMCDARRHCESGIAASRRRSLQQRIYWSCYKSECELRIELNLPNSCLSDLDYPDLHPEPPETFAQHIRNDVPSPCHESTPPFGTRRTFDHEEQSWYYYLTEITLRRLGNRICNIMYAGDHTSWNSEAMPFLLKTAEEFEAKFDEWYSTLPSLIRFIHDEVPTGELPSLVEGRVVEIKGWLYRPFLYYAIHSRPDAPYRSAAQHLADKALIFGLRMLKLGTNRHRTHGTWYGLRESTASVFCILAAARCGAITMPPGWRESVDLCIDTMRYWESEVPTVDRSIRIIQEYLETMEPIQNGGRSVGLR